jgi:hypothetical protein
MREGRTTPFRETDSPRGARAGFAGAGAFAFAAAPSKKVRPCARETGTAGDGAGTADGKRMGDRLGDDNGDNDIAGGTKLLNGVNGMGNAPTDPNGDATRTWAEHNDGKNAITRPQRLLVFITGV